MKKFMKRIGEKSVAALSLFLLTFLLGGCGKKEEMEEVRVAALKGPTAVGMVQMMEEDSMPYNFAIYASIDEVTPKLVQGEVDIAAVPANIASVLYNNTEGRIQVLAINTLGVLYIVDTDGSIQSVGDLKGKTIYASGKGATPEYAARMKNDSIRVALDLTEQWDMLQEGEENSGAMITGVIVARKEFVEGNPEVVEKFMRSYRESVDYVNGNIDEAAGLIEKYDIVPAAVAKEALPYCKIVFIDGEEMKEKLSGYLQVLMEQNPKSVGGKLPDDRFYFRGQ